MSGTFTTRPSVSGLTDTVPGLSPSTSYDFQVAAANSVGTSAPTSLLTVITPATASILPSAPLSVGDSSVGSTTVNITWLAPTTGTTPFTYLVQFALAGTGSWVNGPTVSILSGQVTGLTASTSYDFRVFASNLAGQGPASATFTISTVSASTLVTWQPVGASPTAAFSNGNLTVSMNGGSATPNSLDQSCISTVAQNAGKFSFEVTVTSITGNTSIGLVSPNYVMGSVGSFGAGTTAVGFYPSTAPGNQPPQTVAFNNAFILVGPGNTPASDVNGATFTWCVDVTNGLFWVTGPSMQASYGATAWNDSATANPATGVGGVAIGVVGSIFIGFASSESGAVGVLNAGSSAFTRTVPSTFPPWSGGVIVIVIPGAVTGLAAGAPGGTTMPLTWAAPATGTSPFTYTVQFKLHSASTFSTFGTTGSLSATVTGLTTSSSYDFQVFATNSAGQGGASNTVTASTTAPVALPGQVSGVSVSGIASSAVTVSWAAPSTGGAPTGYQVQFKLSTAGTFTNFNPTAAASVFSQVVSGLTASTAYNFQVFAFNGTGNGAVSAPAVNATTLSNQVSPNQVAISMSVLTGGTLHPTVFGSSIASDGGSGGPATGGQYGTWLNPTHQNTAKNTAGFGLPTMFLRSNTNELAYNSDGSVDASVTAAISSALPNLIGPGGIFTMSLGGPTTAQTTNPTTFANSAVSMYNTFLANGTPVKYYEVLNEPDGRIASATFIAIFNATAKALHARDSTVKVIGPVSASLGTGDFNFQSWVQQCGANCDIVCYHNYSLGEGSPNDSSIGTIINSALNINGAAQVRQDCIAAGFPNIPSMNGEYAINGASTYPQPGDDVNEPTIVGMVSTMLILFQSFSQDNLFTYGAAWDWMGDGYYGLFIDPANNPGNLPADMVTTRGYALKYCRQFLGGPVVQTVVGSGTPNLKVLACNNSGAANVWMINYNQTTTYTVNVTGLPAATYTRTEVSTANPTGLTTTVSQASLGNLSVPAFGLVIISP